MSVDLQVSLSHFIGGGDQYRHFTGLLSAPCTT